MSRQGQKIYALKYGQVRPYLHLLHPALRAATALNPAFHRNAARCPQRRPACHSPARYFAVLLLHIPPYPVRRGESRRRPHPTTGKLMGCEDLTGNGACGVAPLVRARRGKPGSTPAASPGGDRRECGSVSSSSNNRCANRLREAFVARLARSECNRAALVAVARRLRVDPMFRPKRAARTPHVAWTHRARHGRLRQRAFPGKLMPPLRWDDGKYMIRVGY